MKKYFALGLMIALGFTACQKDEIADATATGNQNAISHNFTVSPDEWSDGTRTVYEEGVGVHMTGLEEITVYYGDHQYASSSTEDASKLQKVTGTPNGAFDYTFSHTAIAGATAYDYYFVLPNTTTNSSQSKSHRPYVYLNTIQYPTATSFDPAQDYLIGTPKYGVDQSTEFGSINFKRLFAPLRVTLTGIPEGEKVRYATLMQTGACNTMNPLVGSAYLRFEHIEGGEVSKSEEFADATINSWLSTGYANKVTAYYGEGLATESGACDAWYVINPRVCDSENPTTISGDMTYWVVTDNKLITRTVTLAQPIKFTKYLLNKFSFNVTGEGYTEQKALTQDFTKLSSLSNTLTASDGEAHTWGFTGCKIQNNGLFAQNNSGATITLPTLPDQRITKIMILQGLSNLNNSNVSTLQLMADGAAVGDVSDFNTQRLLTNTANGYLVIDVPEEYQASALSITKPATDKNALYIGAITLVYEEDTTPSVKIESVSATTDSFNITVSGKNVAAAFWALFPKGTPAPEKENWMDWMDYNPIDFELENPATLFVNSLPTAPYNLEPDTEYDFYVYGIQVDEDWNPIDYVLVSKTIKTQSASSEMTYSEMYEAGMTFTIGDLEINKTNYPTAKTVAISALKNADLTAGGLVFVTGEGSYTMTTSPGIHTNFILVGDNPKVQPVIRTPYKKSDGTYTGGYFATRGTDNVFAFKNICVDGTPTAESGTVGSSYLFANTDNSGGAGDIGALYIEDCTLISNGSFVQDTNSTMSMKKVVVNNNVIKFPNVGNGGKYLVGAASGKTGKDLSMMSEITVTNNVIYADSPISQYIVSLGSASQTYSTLNVSITVDHNSIYNVYHGNGMVSVYNAKSIDFTYNVMAFDNSSLNKNPYCTGWYDPDNSITVEATYNRGWTNGVSKWSGLKKDKTISTTVHTKDNNFTMDANPFSATDTTNGYIPVDATVVDNGAGASYETKLWKNWAE